MFSLEQHMGVLFLSCCFMWTDIRRFLALLGVNMLGFGLCVAGISLSAGGALALVPDGAAADGGAVGGDAGGGGAAADGGAAALEGDSFEGASPWESFLLPFWAIFGISLGFDERLLSIPRPLSVLLWVYFLLSQVTLP